MASGELDEARTRFVHPQDNSLIVYFEWDAPAGNHTLTALWKQPDGRIASISPDVKMETTTSQLTSYWTYLMRPDMEPGVWTVEVRMDGQPAGSHSFEIAGTSPPKQEKINSLPETFPDGPETDLTSRISCAVNVAVWQTAATIRIGRAVRMRITEHGNASWQRRRSLPPAINQPAPGLDRWVRQRAAHTAPAK